MRPNYKKTFIGIFAAAIAVCGSLAAFTADSRAYSGKEKGSGHMEGTVATDVFKVILPAVPEKNVDKNAPVATIYDFILDPNKLLTTGDLANDRYPGKSFEPDATLFFENTIGSPSYDYSHTSDRLTIQNKSTMNVDVKLNAAITGMKNVTLTNDSSFADDKNASVYLSLTDNNGKISPIDKYGAFLRATLTGRPNAYKYVYDTASAKYKYELKSETELSANNITFADFTFWLTGACNSANDWKNMPEPITPKLTATWTVAPRPDNVAPSIGKTSYSMSTGQPNIIDVDLGSGNLAASDITSITYKGPSDTFAILDAGNYTFANDTLTLNAQYITDLIESGVKSRNHTVTFNDTASTHANVTLTINDIAPSIEETSYPMVNGQPILVDIDLGSGNLKATDIKSITFVNKDNKTVTLSADYYTLNDGTLTLNASLINTLFKNGVISRDYIITMNDRTATKLTITLTADGTFPSISVNSYAVSRDESVSIDVDLGSDDLKANGIESITFINKAGTIMTLPTEQYTLTNSSTLIIDASQINTFIDNGNISRTYTVTFDNPARTKAEFTLTADESAPTLPQDTYTMTNGQPVLVDIDMGSGSLGATGIKTITFTNSAGALTTLGTDRYSFSDGTLRFYASTISTMFTNGVASRAYSIVLNDKNSTTLTVTLVADGTLPSIPTSAYTMYRGQPVSINVDLGSGEIGAEQTGIKSFTFVNKLGDVVAVPTDSYTFNGTTLVLDAAHITTCIDNGNVSRTYTVTFDNLAKTKAKFTLTADEKAPTLPQDTYTMTNNQPVLVDIDMGSGSLGATGIKTINFTNKAGAVTTLGTDRYSFSGGILRFYANTINDMFINGVPSREYRIVLNDKNATTLSVTLAANGQLPNIPTTAYTMNKNQSVSVGIDMGKGEIGANAISSITFITKSGAVMTLGTDNYTYNNTTLTINASHITSCINNGNVSRTYTVTFNNIAKTKASFVLTAPDVSPVLAGPSTYTMTKGQPILVKIDTGSGRLMATGIKSITFLNKANATTTLGSDMYTFSDGTLKFKATHINNVLNNGIQSRPYTIILNDSKTTRITITFKK